LPAITPALLSNPIPLFEILCCQSSIGWGEGPNHTYGVSGRENWNISLSLRTTCCGIRTLGRDRTKPWLTLTASYSGSTLLWSDFRLPL